MNNRPVAIGAAVGTVLTTSVALAAILYPDRLPQAVQVAIIAFGNSIIGAGVVLWTQLQVTPLADPKLEAGSEVKILDRQGTPTGDTVIVQTSPPGSVDVPGGDPEGAAEAAEEARG